MPIRLRLAVAFALAAAALFALGGFVAEVGVCVVDLHNTAAGGGGDVVFGDREGIYFIPPHLVKKVLDKADETHIHDEWTKKKFDEGKYKSSEIYGSPKDPKLQQEYKDYLKKRLEEIRSQRASH